MTDKCFFLLPCFGHHPGLSHPACLSTPFSCPPPPLPPKCGLGVSPDLLRGLEQGLAPPPCARMPGTGTIAWGHEGSRLGMSCQGSRES